MSLVRYFARRSLILGVGLGDQITLQLPIKYAGLMPQRMALVNTKESMSGKSESYYYRGKVSYVVNLIPVDSTIAERVRMFLDSVEDGQVFAFAPAGILSTPSPAYRNARIDQATYSYGPHAGLQSLTQFSPFTIVEVP